MIWVHRCSVAWVSRQAAVGNSGQGACEALFMVHRNRLSSASPDTKRPGAIRPGLYMRTRKRCGFGLFRLRRVLGEGGVNFIFLDAGSGISGLAEVLFLGAVAGMRHGGALLFGIGLVGHFEISRRSRACPNRR